MTRKEMETPGTAIDLPQELSCYLLLIHDLLNEKGYVRGVELAERLQMSRPTVTRAMQRLAALGYAHYERYRGLTLTPAGIEAAQGARERYEIISGLLKKSGVEMENLQLRARRLESFCDQEMIEAFRSLNEKLEQLA